MSDCNPPVVDLGNYPVIFASCVARIDKLSHGLVSIAMAEERRNDDGVMERVIVCRLIRPMASMQMTDRLCLAGESPGGMQ